MIATHHPEASSPSHHAAPPTTRVWGLSARSLSTATPSEALFAAQRLCGPRTSRALPTPCPCGGRQRPRRCVWSTGVRRGSGSVRPCGGAATAGGGRRARRVGRRGENAQTAVAQRPRLPDEEGAVGGGRVGRARSPKPSLIGLVFGPHSPPSEARALARASCVVARRRRAPAVRSALHAITMAAIATARPNPRRCVGGRSACHPPPPPHNPQPIPHPPVPRTPLRSVFAGGHVGEWF